MQNPRFLQQCKDDVLRQYPQAEFVGGDTYFPLLGVRIADYVLTDPIVEASVDILVPMPACSGYLKDAYISGVHLSSELHVQYGGELSRLPFCLEVTSNDLAGMSRYYPLYKHETQVTERHLLCLYSEVNPPATPLQAVRAFDDYLKHYLVICNSIAHRNHDNVKWLRHLVSDVSPGLKQYLLRDIDPLLRVQIDDE